MDILTATENTLSSLIRFLDQVKAEDYKKPVELFNGSTIGEHTRHIIEFYQCLQKFNHTGIINYDKRERDRMIQEDPEMAQLAVRSILDDVQKMDLNKEIRLEVAYDTMSNDTDVVSSNLKREIAYNLEHAIHHMALIKVGVLVVAPYIQLDDNFGIAPSTVKYKQNICVQ